MKNFKFGTARKILVAAPMAGVAATSAQAAIIYTSLGSPITSDNSFGSIYFNPVSGAATTISYASDYFSLQNKFGKMATVNGYGDATRQWLLGTSYPAKLAYGAAIGGSGSFAASGPLNSFGTGEWSGDGSLNYLGFEFGASPSYGWAEISLNADFSITIYGFAYEDVPGTPIAAGHITAGAEPPVPEPAETAVIAGLLAGSAAAYAAMRKRREKKAA